MKPLLLLLLLLPPAALAQRGALSGGNDAAGAGGSISYSIGQVGYTAVSDQGGTSSAGVQQPLEYLVLAVDEEEAAGAAHLSPNPTSEGVQLTLSWEPGTTQFYVLMDAAGQVLRTSPITGPVMDISMGDLPSAIYLLRVEGGGGHTFQIIKQ
jgi:hypothetical protein